MITPAQDQGLRNLVIKYPGHFMAKFCIRPMSWYAIADRIAGELGLHEEPPKYILDIGCGFGYFAKACTDRGHDVIGLDIPDDMIREANRILDVRFMCSGPSTAARFRWEQQGLFDVVTTFGVNFKGDNGTYWDHRDYAPLANDICEHLTPGGSWILRPNQTDDPTHPIANLMRAEWWMAVVPAGTSVSITHNQVEIKWT